MQARFFLFYFIFISPLAFSQTKPNDCWRCIIASENDSTSITIDQCTYDVKKNGDSEGGQIASFILASALMEQQKFTKALTILKNVDIQNKIFSSYVLGLQADCYSELGDTKKAVEFYEQAILNDFNTLTTPAYLLKAFTYSKSLGEMDRAQLYLNALWYSFSEFAKANSVELNKKQGASSEAFQLPEQPSYSPEIMGYGTINGKSVNGDSFRREVELKQVIAQQQKDQQLIQQGKLSGSEKADLVDLDVVWISYAEKFLLNKEFAELKLIISEAEFDSYLYGENGFSVLPDLENAFADPQTGRFNPKLLQARIDEMENYADPAIQALWEETRVNYKNQRLFDKYRAILNRGVYFTKIDVDSKLADQSNTAEIDFVHLRYSDIDDDGIPVNDALLKKHFIEHKNDEIYKHLTASREFLFFDLPVVSSSSDTVQFYSDLKALKEGFKNASNDSLFVMKHSDSKFFSRLFTYFPDDYEGDHFGKAEYPALLHKEIQKSEIGDVVGPYEQDGTIRIAKNIGFNRNIMSARHIMIATQRDDVEGVKKARETAERLLLEINHGNFGEYVKRYSEDHGSKEKGGEISDFMEGMMVREFDDYCTNEPIGKIGYIQTDFGFHIVEVLKREPVKFAKLAVVEKSIEISENSQADGTLNNQRIIKRLKSELEGLDGAAKKARFEEIAIEEGATCIPVILMDDRPKANHFSETTEGEVLKFMYAANRKVGDLTPSPIVGDQRYVFGLVSSMNKPQNMDAPRVKYSYLNEQKAKQLIAKLKINGTLEAIAAKTGTKVKSSYVSLMNRVINGVGPEPMIIERVIRESGTIKTDEPIEGNLGVYVIRITKTRTEDDRLNYADVKWNLISNEKYRQKIAIKRALIQRAQVVNNVRLYNLGVRP